MSKRPYTMRARAESTRATYRRILDAAEQSFLERWYDEVTLDQVADLAGVSKQTVLRRFGSKEALFTAVADDVAARNEAHRADVAPGDLQRAAAALASDHERTATTAARLEAMEERFPSLEPLLAASRASRKDWVERTFGDVLPARSAKSYRRRVAQLMAVTSAQTWRQLRHDGHLSKRDAERALHGLLVGVASATD